MCYYQTRNIICNQQNTILFKIDSKHESSKHNVLLITLLRGHRRKKFVDLLRSILLLKLCLVDYWIFCKTEFLLFSRKKRLRSKSFDKQMIICSLTKKYKDLHAQNIIPLTSYAYFLNSNIITCYVHNMIKKRPKNRYKQLNRITSFFFISIKIRMLFRWGMYYGLNAPTAYVVTKSTYSNSKK